jgi:hypothetical protein
MALLLLAALYSTVDVIVVSWCRTMQRAEAVAQGIAGILQVPRVDRSRHFTRSGFRDSALVLMAQHLGSYEAHFGHLPPQSAADPGELERMVRKVEKWGMEAEAVGAAASAPGYFDLNYDYSYPPDRRFDRMSEETVILSERLLPDREGRTRFLSTRGFVYYADLPASLEPGICSLAGLPFEEIQAAGVSIRRRRFGTDALLIRDSQALWRVYGSLMRIERETGELPYDLRGSDYALRRLQSLPSGMALPVIEASQHWENTGQRAIESHYDYVNRPGLRLFESGAEPYVVIAEKSRGGKDCPILFMTSSGECIFGAVSSNRMRDVTSLVGLGASYARGLLDEELMVWPPETVINTLKRLPEQQR